MDDNLLTSVTLDKKGDAFYDVDYVIPEKLLNPDQEKMNIKFRAHEGSVVGGIYYIRLLKEGD